MYGPLGPKRRRLSVIRAVKYLSNIVSSGLPGHLIGPGRPGDGIVLMGSGIPTSPRNPLLNMRKAGSSAAQRARQLPITEFAHKAGNGARTITCGNRHCPKCQGAASRRWLADREAELLPVPYFHVVYTLPSELRDVAYQNKRVIYKLLMKAAAETTLAIASDPKHLGARIGIIAVLHTWGSAMTQNPHSRYRALSSP